MHQFKIISPNSFTFFLAGHLIYSHNFSLFYNYYLHLQLVIVSIYYEIYFIFIALFSFLKSFNLFTQHLYWLFHFNSTGDLNHTHL